ncbi:MAG: hypothetical protein KL863_08660 [Rhizobium sp.]|nr:hypothetical protein [Rhizobium sp.]
MIFLHKARLVILSQPKTGTTALEAVLSPRASISVSKPPELKHMSYRGFMKFVAPLIEAQTGLDRSDYEVVAVMREPVDWLGSWYRYRTRDELKKPGNPRAVNFTGNISFDDFVRDVCQPDGQQPQHARIKTPSWVALGGNGRIGVDRLFPYEALENFFDYIVERTGKPIETKAANVSPKMDLVLAPDVLEQLRLRFAFEFALHESLRADGAVDARFQPTSAKIAEDDLSPAV